MPILEIPREGSPLSQGDVLKGLSLFATGGDWETGGGSKTVRKSDISLVISRPCVIVNKPKVVVAAVKRYREHAPKGIESVDEVLRFLDDLRDGVGRPDRFYLGQIPSQPPGRYFAELDSLHTVTLPEIERDRILAGVRIAALTPEFVRDLHARIFMAFASLGFDSHQWYSREDLEWVVITGDARHQAILTQASQKKAEAASVRSSGNDDSHLNKKIEELNSQADTLADSLAPFREELKRRNE